VPDPWLTNWNRTRSTDHLPLRQMFVANDIEPFGFEKTEDNTRGRKVCIKWPNRRSDGLDEFFFLRFVDDAPDP
jgi:hypothetical protein